jgi:KaiC/GvpD/RAD55 family RecA-like ATPase
LGELIPDGLEYGRSYLIEFESQSLWYEVSLTIAAYALKNRQKTEYHTYLHPPNEVRKALSMLGIESKAMEDEGLLRVIDSYTLTVGVGNPEKPAKGPEPYQVRSIDATKWGNELQERIRQGIGEDEKKWLHIDEATSILGQYSDEKTVLENVRTRWIPYVRARQLADFASLMVDSASTAYYKMYEIISDGIFEFQSQEHEGRIEQYARVRMVRGRTCDTRWRRLSLQSNGEVKLGDKRIDSEELGIRGWLGGSARR